MPAPRKKASPAAAGSAVPGTRARRGKAPRRKGLAKGTLLTAGRLLATAIMVMIITGCIVACVLTVYILGFIKQDNNVDLNNISLNYTSIIYVEEKESGEFYELQRLHGKENRIWVEIDQMPKYLQHAVVALEDKRFYEHQGVDWQRTAAAFVNQFVPILKGNQGGSTLTQQLIKNITGEDEVRVERKVKEIFSALALSKKFSRDQILEAYLNTVAFGNNTNGVQAAANLYFNKDVSELTLAECASIISITQNPTKFDPFTRPENNVARRNDALYFMHEQGYITDREYEQALKEELVTDRTQAVQKLNSSNNWFVDYLIEAVISDLMAEKGITYRQAESLLFRSGYRIYTTMDTEIQSYLDENYLIGNKIFPKVTNKEYPESAFVVMDKNGKILALAGSDREKTGDRMFNRATEAVRHPGSTIKPISAYLQGFETNLITWSSMWDDNPIEYKGSTYPRNYYGTYLGNITIDEAVRRSTNTIPVKIIQAITPQRSFDFLKNRLGVDSLVAPEDIDLGPMALGGMNKGMTPLELAGAYQVYANGGMFTRPYCYTRVEDSGGNIVLEKDTSAERVISYETSTIVNKLMQRVTSAPLGTGTAANLGTMPVAGKTGTSSDDKDQWFVGITPYYIGVVWLGYDHPQQIRYTSLPYPPPVLWKNVMRDLHEGLDPVQFDASPNVVSMNYCTVSGDLATDYCPTTAVGWYKTSYIPGSCTAHINLADSWDWGNWGGWGGWDDWDW